MTEDAPPRRLALATLAVASGRPPRVPDGPLNPPVLLASTYHAGGDTGYGRYGNETWTALEATLGALEGGRACIFASGMAAVAAVLATVPNEGVVVVPERCYYMTRVLLDDLAGERGLQVRPVDDLTDRLDDADLVWVETPANPTLEVTDLRALAATAHEAGAIVVCDNTFATPVAQRPLELGADVVVHSVTKFLSGHSDVLLGATVTADEALHQRFVEHRSRRGAVPGPLEAWLALRGVRTLHLRMERAHASAATLAVRLSEHPDVEAVHYPGLPDHPGHAVAAAQMDGFGAMVSFVVRGGAAAADRLSESVQLWVHATSLGGVESSLERRRRWPGEITSVPPGLIRASVGCEAVDDLWADLDDALQASRAESTG